MKAIIIKATTGTIAKFEDGTTFNCEADETLKAFKSRIKAELELTHGDVKVSFKNANFKNESTDTLEVWLDDATHAVEVDAISEELATREDYQVEDTVDVTDEEETVDVSEDTEEAVEADQEPAELTPLQEAAKCLQEAKDALATAKSSVKEKVDAAKEEVSNAVAEAKNNYELAKIDTEQVINEAETAYNAARRQVAVNNMGAGEEAKTQEEKDADAAKLSECKEALDQVKVDAKETVKEAKEAWDELRTSQKEKVDAVKEECREALEEARKALEQAQNDYSQALANAKEEAEQVIVVAEEELTAAEQAVEDAKQALADAKKQVSEAKDKLRQAKSTLKSSPSRSTQNPSITLAEAEAERTAGDANRGKLIAFVPSTGGEAILGRIKTTTLDKRTNLAYYRIIGEGNNDDNLDGKMYHRRIASLDVAACEVEETTEA